MEDYRLEQSGQEVQDILNGAAMQVDLTEETERAELAEQTLQGKIDDEETRAKAAEKQNADDIDALEDKVPSGASSSNKLATEEYVNNSVSTKQDTLTFDNLPTEGSNNPVKSGGVYSADKALSDAIEAILLLIPSAATSLNKLTDKAFVNSSIATASATFRGTYNLVTDLSLTVSATHAQIATALAGAVSDEDNNDYAFVQIPTSDATPTQIAKTERYKFNGTAWEYEYDLNNSGYTAAQWAAINSGITEALVTKLSALPTNTELTSALGVLTSSITTINQKIPSAASQSNQLVDTSYLVQVLDVLTASFNVTSTDGHVTVQISQVDGKITSVAVTGSDIASAASLSLIAGRVTTAEGNISTNAADIANLQAAYAALTQSDIVVVEGALPSTGQQINTIYRQPDQDHTPPQFYSDYMWNGTAWVLMAKYNNAIDPRPKKASQNLVTSGGVFDNMGALDVSELNATENPHTLATYADLSAAIAAIPSDYQKGGMSIKFVQSSDNKYIQARCMAQNFTTDVTQWQGVDDAPIAGSDNLVKSGGVYEEVSYLELHKADLDEVIISRNLFDKSKIEQGWIGTGADGGDVVHGDGPGYQVSPLIPISPNTIYYITYSDGLISKAFRFVDADGNPLKALSVSGTELSWALGQSMAVKSPSTAKYAQFQVLFNYNGDADQTQFEVGNVPTPHQDYEDVKLLPESELPLSVQELIHGGGEIVRKHKLTLNLNAGVLSSVTSPFNSTHDLKMTFYVNQPDRNRLFNWDRYYLVNKSTGVETLAKWADDDTCPELLDAGMGYIGANHGASQFFICGCNGHDKTTADIGSVWSNGTRNFTIVGVETGIIHLIGNNIATYPDWYFSTPDGTDTFTHVSGATHTNPFTITSRSYDQWMPICYTRARKVYLDGKEILENGDYTFNEMQIVETYDVLNPASVLEKIQSGVGSFSQNPLPTDFAGVADSVLEHSITYTFEGANQNMIATSVTYMQPVSFGHFGFIQCIELPSEDGLKLYIPKAKSKNNGQDAVDFRTIVDASMGTGYIEGNDFENPNLPPDRELQFNPEIGVMIGYLFDYGVGGDNRKDALVDHKAIYQSESGLKMYPLGISGNTLTQYGGFSAVCFKSFLDRSGINTGGVIAKNVFEYNNRCYIFGDFNASGIYDIMIPEKYIGHKVNVFEMRENVCLLNEIATDRVRIRVNNAAVMYGYFVACID